MTFFKRATAFMVILFMFTSILGAATAEADSTSTDVKPTSSNSINASDQNSKKIRIRGKDAEPYCLIAPDRRQTYMSKERANTIKDKLIKDSPLNKSDFEMQSGKCKEGSKSTKFKKNKDRENISIDFENNIQPDENIDCSNIKEELKQFKQQAKSVKQKLQKIKESSSKPSKEMDPKLKNTIQKLEQRERKLEQCKNTKPRPAEKRPTSTKEKRPDKFCLVKTRKLEIIEEFDEIKQATQRQKKAMNNDVKTRLVKRSCDAARKKLEQIEKPDKRSRMPSKKQICKKVKENLKAIEKGEKDLSSMSDVPDYIKNSLSDKDISKISTKMQGKGCEGVFSLLEGISNKLQSRSETKPDSDLDQGKEIIEEITPIKPNEGLTGSDKSGNTEVKAGGFYTTPDSSTVYKVVKTSDGLVKRPVQNPRVLQSHFKIDDLAIIFSRVQEVRSPKLDSVPNSKAGFLPWGQYVDFKDGSLVKTIVDNRVYLVMGDSKYYFTNQDDFCEFYGRCKWGSIRDVSEEFVDKLDNKGEVPLDGDDYYPEGMMVKYKFDNGRVGKRVYKLERSSSDKTAARPVGSYQAFKQLGFYEPGIAVTKKDFPKGETITASKKLQ